MALLSAVRAGCFHALRRQRDQQTLTVTQLQSLPRQCTNKYKNKQHLSNIHKDVDETNRTVLRRDGGSSIQKQSWWVFI